MDGDRRQCRSSGQTVAVWCAENNIKPASYYYWLRRIRKAACEALVNCNLKMLSFTMHLYNRGFTWRGGYDRLDRQAKPYCYRPFCLHHTRRGSMSSRCIKIAYHA
ncbi:IS66 family insertion sequence element accessory protein TnpA [Brevibacillus parabrevis]|uniref:IS66 family insertion sequence element accessory protein TnpA n=1 Tax=Brevibacillus parabrevis TaxID=54914 RepID=UPI003B84B742